MKTVFQAMAKYNKNVNLEVISLLGNMPADKLTNKTKAFYPAIQDAVVHILTSDIGLFKRSLKTAFPASKALNSSQLFTADIPALKTEIEADIKKYFQYRKEADNVIIQFVDELSDGDLNGPLKFTGHKGAVVETTVWKMLLMIFNHQTHHRGGVSVMLELEDVNNDYAGTLARI
jgi:uncharacterized damage-inducible protein DinB